MTAITTTTVRLPEFAIETAAEWRAEIETLFWHMATPAVRDAYTPQQVMVTAAVRCGMRVEQGFAALCDSDDVFVRAGWGTVFGFRIDTEGDLWLADGIGRLVD